MTTLRKHALAALAAAALAVPAAAEDAPKLEWTPGPGRMDVGGSLAQVDLPEGMVFLDKKNTRKFLEATGNLPGDSELATVSSAADDENWFVVFEWDPVGFVKDDEKDSIDADAILERIREGTEASNERRKENGGSALHVVGWSEKPHYDAVTHNLTWAILAKDEDGGEVVNHQVRILGRKGVMSAVLVDSPERMAESRVALQRVLDAFSYQQGSTYAEWRPGDKVAEYGLTALVAGGAGAAAAKLGLFGWLGKLLAKGGKAIVVGVAALGAAIAKGWRRLSGRREADARASAPAAPSTTDRSQGPGFGS